MTLKEILQKYSDKEILKKVFEFYPDQKKSKDGYLNALDELRHKRSRKSNIKVDVSYVNDYFDKTEYVSVDGFDPNDVTTSYAIEFIPWSEWLGAEITIWSFENFDELSILAYCLWEMTWRGYSCKQVRQQYSKIVNTVEEIKLNADVA